MARPKGAKNKLGTQARENIVAVFTRLGGTAAMAEWAKDHPTDFYKMYASLVPKEVNLEASIRTETDLTDAELAAIARGSSAGASEEAGSEADASSVH